MRPSSRWPHACGIASAPSQTSARIHSRRCARPADRSSCPPAFSGSSRRESGGPSRAALWPPLLSEHRRSARMRAECVAYVRRPRARGGCGGCPSLRIVSACRNSLALADAHLRHRLDQFSSCGVCPLEGLAQHLHLIALLLGGDRESIRRLFGTTGCRAPPRAVDEFAANEVSSFPALKRLYSGNGNATRVHLLLIESSCDAVRDELPHHYA